MATKSTTTELTKEEIKYQRRVKSIELAIRTQGSKGALSDTIVKVAEKIYTYIST